MRCESVRQWLEACRHGTDDRETPALAEAAGHLEQCADCRAALRAIEAVDALIGAKVRDVPVPDSLKERLLDRLAAARAPFNGTTPAQRAGEIGRRGATWQMPAPPAPEPVKKTSAARRWRRKRIWVPAVIGSAAALVLLAAWLGGWGSSATWTIEQLHQRVSDRAFDGAGVPASPNVPRPPLRQAALLAGRTKTIEGRTVCLFHYRVFAAGRQFDAEVYVVPESFVQAPVPPLGSRQVSTAGGNAIVTWSDRGHVYVFITRAAQGVQLFEHLLQPAQLT